MLRSSLLPTIKSSRLMAMEEEVLSKPEELMLAVNILTGGETSLSRESSLSTLKTIMLLMLVQRKKKDIK